MLDATGCVVAPGFVDLHAHLREPGREEAETIETGSRAAALGGFTCVVAMPNTDPTPGLGERDRVRPPPGPARRAVRRAPVRVDHDRPRAASSSSPLAELAAAGVRLFTDDGNGVQDPLLMRRALEYALDLGVVLAQHCEVARLTDGAVMHEGDCCSRLGLPGWPAMAEELMVASRHRARPGSPVRQVHLLHLSTAGSVELVRRAKADGLARHRPRRRRTTSASPTSCSPATTRSSRSTRRCAREADVDAVRAGPGRRHDRRDRHRPRARTRRRPRSSRSTRRRPGCSGWRPRSASALSELDLPIARRRRRAVVAAGRDRRCRRPRTGGRSTAGEPANLAVFDPDATWTVDPARLASKQPQHPVRRSQLRGQVRHTVLRGEPVVVDGEAPR